VIITKLQVAPVELEPVEPVELDVSSESSCALRLARHSQNAWARHIECVESSRAKWNLSLTEAVFSTRNFCLHGLKVLVEWTRRSGDGRLFQAVALRMHKLRWVMCIIHKLAQTIIT